MKPALALFRRGIHLGHFAKQIEPYAFVTAASTLVGYATVSYSTHLAHMRYVGVSANIAGEQPSANACCLQALTIS